MPRKTPKHIAAEAALSEELRAEFNVFLTITKRAVRKQVLGISLTTAFLPT
jgi:hypothetical protein